PSLSVVARATGGGNGQLEVAGCNVTATPGASWLSMVTRPVMAQFASCEAADDCPARMSDAAPSRMATLMALGVKIRICILLSPTPQPELCPSPIPHCALSRREGFIPANQWAMRNAR